MCVCVSKCKYVCITVCIITVSMYISPCICASTVSKCTLMFRSMVRQRRLTLDTSLFVCRSTTLLSLDGGYWLQKTLHTPHRHVPLHTPCMCSFSAPGGRSLSPRTLCQNTGSFGAVGGPLLYQSLSYTTGMFWGCVQSVHEIHRHIKETVFQGIFSESWIIHCFIPSHLQTTGVSHFPPTPHCAG